VLQTLAEFLDTWQQELIKRWMGALRETAAGASLSERQLEDRLLTYLRRLSEALAHSDRTAPSPAALAETQRAAAEHGEQRLELGYDIAAVVRDYAALPATLHAFLRERGFEPSGEEVFGLSSFLVEGIATAAHAYSLERDAKVREAAAQHTGFLVHDLRQPLQSLRLRFDLLERRGGALSHDDTRLIRSALESLSDQVDGALRKSRLEALPTPQMETVAVKALLDDLTNLVMPIAEAKGVSISVECESELALEADPRLLSSALSNLVHNGVKFSEAGTVSLRARATKPGKVVFEVEDACGGLPPGVTEKLFDPFVQLGEDRSGFGLGLALARRVADLHGGALRVHDLPGRGCVFVLELPIRHLETLQ
jgi:signal transduction histidine kinase